MYTRKPLGIGAHMRRIVIMLSFSVSVAGIPSLLSACDDTVSHDKQTTTRTVQTPEGTTKTTTTTEKKVEETPKP